IEAAERVAARRLDLHDLGAPIRKHPRGGWTRDPEPELDDAEPFERAGHQGGSVDPACRKNLPVERASSSPSRRRRASITKQRGWAALTIVESISMGTSTGTGRS